MSNPNRPSLVCEGPFDSSQVPWTVWGRSAANEEMRLKLIWGTITIVPLRRGKGMWKITDNVTPVSLNISLPKNQPGSVCHLKLILTSSKSDPLWSLVEVHHRLTSRYFLPFMSLDTFCDWKASYCMFTVLGFCWILGEFQHFHISKYVLTVIKLKWSCK